MRSGIGTVLYPIYTRFVKENKIVETTVKDLWDPQVYDFNKKRRRTKSLFYRVLEKFINNERMERT